MKPLLLKMTGFKSFVKQQTIDFTELSRDGIFGICGDTGSGKSSILAAVLYALYGKRGDNEQVLNIKSDKLSVELSFEAGGKVYEVIRTLSKSKGGNVTKSAKLFEIDDGQVIPLTEKNDTAVTREITRLIGLDLNDFTQCVVLEQGGYDKFLNLSRVERVNAMERIFKLDRYGDRLSDKIKLKRDEGRDIIKQLNTRIEERSQFSDSTLKQSKKQQKQLIKEMEELIRQKQQLLSLLLEAQNGLKTANEARGTQLELNKCLDSMTSLNQKTQQMQQTLRDKSEVFSEVLWKNRRKIEQLNAERAKMAALRPLFDTVKEIDKEIDKLNGLLATNEEQLSLAASMGQQLELSKGDNEEQQLTLVRQLSESGAHFGDFAALSEGLSGLVLQKQQREKELSQLAQLKKQIDSKERLVFEAGARAAQLKKQLNEREIELVRDMDNLDISERQNMAAALSQRCKIGEKCPICGGVIERFCEGGGEVEKYKQIYLKTQKEVKDLKGKYNDAIVANSAAAAELELLNRRFEQENPTQTAEIDAIKATAQDLDGILTKARALSKGQSALLKQQQSNKEKLIELTAQVHTTKEKIALLAQQRMDTMKKLGGLDLCNFEGDLKNIEQELAFLNEQIKNGEAEIALMRTQLDTLKQQLAHERGRHNQLQIRLDELKKSKQCGLDEVERLQQSADEVERKINQNSSQSGAISVQIDNATLQLDIKNQCLEQRAQAIKKQNTIDELYNLVKGNRFLEFIVEEKLQNITLRASERLSGITNGKFELNYDATGFLVVDNFNGGLLRPASTLSGGEAFLASLCLALSISAEISRDRDIGFFFLDEGFGTLDNELVNTVMNAFERLKEQNLTIGLISHRAELTHRLNTKLFVKKVEGEGSVVALN